MKKPKPKSLIQNFREESMQLEVEQIESMLAPTVLKCLNVFGKRSTVRALEWMIMCINQKEDEDASA